MKRRILNVTALPILVAGLAVACSKKKAQEAAVSASHNAADCPDSLRGQKFTAQDSKTPMYIEVIDDKDNKRLDVDFNGVELAPVDGKKYQQRNGAELVAGCTAGDITIAGSDKDGKTLKMTLKRADDGGIQLDKDQPDRVTIHYVKSGIAGTFDKLKQALTPSAVKDKETGIPSADDKVQQTNSPQQQQQSQQNQQKQNR